MSKVVILGVGNILLSDEGVGVKVLEKLKEEFLFPENVALIDGGTLGIGLVPYLEDVDRLVIVDAVSGGGHPGEVYKLEGELARTVFNSRVSAHDINLQEVLGVLDFIGKSPRDVVLIGVEPKVLEPGCDLSPEVESGLRLVIDEIIDLLETWGIKPVRRCEICSEGLSG
ncbi:MAG: HyaD/HybD family hydrogenase maturation endopeptidase [Aquificota bacterium]|nr:HyaD/HybD family hydrogenase maturation endopeptidase [Aquificota bacterium]